MNKKITSTRLHQYLETISLCACPLGFHIARCTCSISSAASPQKNLSFLLCLHRSLTWFRTLCLSLVFSFLYFCIWHVQCKYLHVRILSTYKTMQLYVMCGRVHISSEMSMPLKSTFPFADLFFDMSRMCLRYRSCTQWCFLFIDANGGSLVHVSPCRCGNVGIESASNPNTPTGWNGFNLCSTANKMRLK